MKVEVGGKKKGKSWRCPFCEFQIHDDVKAGSEASKHIWKRHREKQLQCVQRNAQDGTAVHGSGRGLRPPAKPVPFQEIALVRRSKAYFICCYCQKGIYKKTGKGQRSAFIMRKSKLFHLQNLLPHCAKKGQLEQVSCCLRHSCRLKARKKVVQRSQRLKCSQRSRTGQKAWT